MKKKVFEVVVPVEKAAEFQDLFNDAEVIQNPYQGDKALLAVTKEVILSKPEWVLMDTSQDYLKRAESRRSFAGNRELQEIRNYEFLRR